MKLPIFLSLICLITTSGCATIISDNKSFVQIESKPSETVCLLTGDNFKQTITTPANIIIPAKASPVLISCTKDGYFLTAQEIIATMDGSIFGNILFGGVIGVVVDVVNKSGYKYQKKVELYLYKKNFKSQEEKETYYQQELEKIHAETKANKDKLKKKMSDDAQGYPQALKKIDAYYAKQLALLNKNKNLAVLDDNIVEEIK